MRFEEALFAHLKDCTGLKNLVGDRIYPLVLPQKAVLPAVTYQKISGERLHKLQGDTGLTRPVYQLSCWAENYAQCKAAAEQVRLCLQKHSGLMGGAEGSWNVAVDAQGQKALQDAYLSGATVSLKLYVDVAHYYSGEAFISSLSVEDPVDDTANMSFEFQGTGALTYS